VYFFAFMVSKSSKVVVVPVNLTIRSRRVDYCSLKFHFVSSKLLILLELIALSLANSRVHIVHSYARCSGMRDSMISRDSPLYGAV